MKKSEQENILIKKVQQKLKAAKYTTKRVQQQKIPQKNTFIQILELDQDLTEGLSIKKVIKKTQIRGETMSYLYQKLLNLSLKTIVTFYQITHKQQQIDIIMEYVKQDILTGIQNINPNLALHLALQCLKTIEQLEKNHIFHLDTYPRNFRLWKINQGKHNEKAQIRLIDFGQSRVQEDCQSAQYLIYKNKDLLGLHNLFTTFEKSEVFKKLSPVNFSLLRMAKYFLQKQSLKQYDPLKFSIKLIENVLISDPKQILNKLLQKIIKKKIFPLNKKSSVLTLTIFMYLINHIYGIHSQSQDNGYKEFFEREPVLKEFKPIEDIISRQSQFNLRIEENLYKNFFDNRKVIKNQIVQSQILQNKTTLFVAAFFGLIDNMHAFITQVKDVQTQQKLIQNFNKSRMKIKAYVQKVAEFLN